MRKKRGLRRYYKKLSDSSFIDNLDFSNSEKSWFDLYHFHIDDTGLGNKSWKSRKQHLDALFAIAHRFEEKLSDYSKEFQYWIMISENDSWDDSIYIHTPNPNKNNFPAEIGFEKYELKSNNQLIEYLKTKSYKIDIKVYGDESNVLDVNYILTRENLGSGIK